MSEPKYYGIAHTGEAYGIVRVLQARPIVQEWTGETFPTWRAAFARMESLNAPIFRKMADGRQS